MNRLDAQRIGGQVRLAGEIAARMTELFADCPELCGFALDDAQGLPLAADGGEPQLCVREIALDPAGDGRRYAEVCDEIVLRVGELLEERPESRALLCGRTFARLLH